LFTTQLCSERLLPVVVLALLVLTTGVVSASEQVTVTVLHTTDLHGHVLAWQDYGDGPAAHGLARLATLVKEARAEDPEALLLDGGDTIQGSPLELVAHTRMPDRPDPTVAVMNLIGYDAMMVGNHDFDFGWETLDAARRSADFPWLAANVHHQGKPAFEIYKVYEVHGVRIGVLGLTTPAVPLWLDMSGYQGVTFEDAVETAQHWVPVLREKERCDAVVIFTHQGLESDPRTGAPYEGQLRGENAAYALATQVPGVDVIIMGHTHRVLPFERVGDVLLTQAGKHAENLGRVTLAFSRENGESPWQLGEKRGNVTPVTLETEPDDAVLAAVDTYATATTAYLDEVVAEADAEFNSALGRLEDNSVLDLIHKVQLEYGEADVSLASLFTTEARFGPGPVQVRDLASIYIYENTLYTIEITGEKLHAALENSARYFRQYDFGHASGSPIAAGFPGFNFDTAAGVTYEIDVTEPPGNRIKKLRYLGNPLDDSRLLRVAVNSYRMSGSGGYGMLSSAKVIKKTNEGIRELLVRYAQGKGTLRPEVDDNWHLTPAYLSSPGRDALDRLVRFGVIPTEEAKKLRPGDRMTRGLYASWLGSAYGPPAASGQIESPFDDVPVAMGPALARAAEAGAFVSFDDDFFRPMDALDLLTAVDWTAHADYGGRIPDRRGGYNRPGREPAQEKHPPVPPELRPENAPALYGETKLPSEVEEFALVNGYMAEWRAGADPMKLTVADGAMLLAAARYPVITVLETTDFHGAMMPGQTERGSDRPVGSTPVLAAYIERERATNPGGTLLIDGGDLMQGTMISNLSHGRAIIAQMNHLDYLATAIGNHEFDWGLDTLYARIKEAEFAALGANLFPVGDSRPVDWVEPYRIFELRGLDVAVIGFCTVATPYTTMPAHVADLQFPDPAPVAQKLVEEVREKGADVVVLVGHLPARQDSLWGPVSGELADLAAQVEGEDVAFGGHSHNIVLGRVDGIPVMIPGAQGRALGRVDLIVDRKSGEVMESYGEIISTYADAIEPDPFMTAFTDSIRIEVAQVADREICEAPEALERNRRSESGIGNWVSDAILKAVNADVALQNPGGLRASIEAGPVTVREVYRVMPFDNVIATVVLTGDQLFEVVEHGVNARGCVQVSGLRYVFDPSRPDEENIIEITLADGSPLDPKAEYLVAVNNFMSQGGDGYTMLSEGKNLEVTSILIRDAMLADCEAKAASGQKLLPPLDGRIRTVESPVAVPANR
jgi:2',3'-cyclic-nucleotide 2'-phosphodiesterase/3'-nucleotidase/5'-nucleotidase